MRALTSFTTTLTLVLGLAACGDDGNVTTTNPTTNTPTGDPTANVTMTDADTTSDPSAGTMDMPTTTGVMNPTTTGDEASGTTADPGTGTTTDAATSSTTDPSVGTTEDVGTTTDTTNTTGGDTTTGGAADPNWPAPDPMNPMMPCEEGFAAASFSMGGVVCAPKCDVQDMCPDGATGDAQPACVFNPDSSGAACKMGDVCEAEKEDCVMTGGGGMACLAPSSHCVLLCTGGETCPDGMQCFDDLICQYPV